MTRCIGKPIIPIINSRQLALLALSNDAYENRDAAFFCTNIFHVAGRVLFNRLAGSI
jgi:hypothetical protein